MTGVDRRGGPVCPLSEDEGQGGPSHESGSKLRTFLRSPGFRARGSVVPRLRPGNEDMTVGVDLPVRPQGSRNTIGS